MEPMYWWFVDSFPFPKNIFNFSGSSLPLLQVRLAQGVKRSFTGLYVLGTRSITCLPQSQRPPPPHHHHHGHHYCMNSWVRGSNGFQIVETFWYNQCLSKWTAPIITFLALIRQRLNRIKLLCKKSANVKSTPCMPSTSIKQKYSMCQKNFANPCKKKTYHTSDIRKSNYT